MKRPRAFVIGFLVIASVVAIGAIYISTVLSRCAYREMTTVWSPDGKFYAQIQATTCQDDDKSHYSLIMGSRDRKHMIVLLDLRSSLREMHYVWREGPELLVSVPAEVIKKRYSDYEEWPRVVVQEVAATQPPKN